MKRKTIFIVAVLLMLFYFSSAVFGAVEDEFDPNQPGFVSRELIYDGPKEQHQSHASTIVQMNNGHLLAAWFQGKEGKDKSVCIYASEGRINGEGYSWSNPVVVGDGKWLGVKFPCWNPVLFQPKNGHLMLFYKVGLNTDFWKTTIKTSIDNGKTWSKGKRTLLNIYGPVKNKPIELDDGTILCPASQEVLGQRVYYSWTKDFGKTWKATGPQNLGFPLAAIQPTLLTYRDSTTGKINEIQSLIRTNKGYIYQQYSDDNGRHWSKMEPTSLVNPDSGIDAVTLSDGRQLLVFNNTKTGRGHLEVAVSNDGVSWQHAFTLQPETGGEFSYPAVIQDKHGYVHITYSWHKQQIMHVVIDPDRLELKLLGKAI
jgi:predicted neuraminidase